MAVRKTIRNEHIVVLIRLADQESAFYPASYHFDINIHIRYDKERKTWDHFNSTLLDKLIGNNNNLNNFFSHSTTSFSRHVIITKGTEVKRALARLGVQKLASYLKSQACMTLSNSSDQFPRKNSIE